ncbi:hypothetical protein [Kitasatospora viridis]|uniref:Uncharacterized protein n=1 Tax=Kitasatospora viridis TaxID=281105 RepID=A0A561UKQ1_9ACTN|nr:hypothetical protein [Kitasatospora viridis]TWF99948.1 hypothetical protein FHX73_113808 [Kitasatospora viridis]
MNQSEIRAVLDAAAERVRAQLIPQPADEVDHHVNDVIERCAAAVLAVPVQLPRTTAAGRTYLARFAEHQDKGQPVHVYRDPGHPNRPGNGVSRPALDRLRLDRLVQLGGYQAQHGRPVLVTDLGRAVLAAAGTGDVLPQEG